jgi:hypothetical protein
MKLLVREHIPGFIEGFAARESVVDTWEQALSLDWLKPQGELVVKPYVSGFLISDHTPTGQHWVRAYVEEQP